MGFETVEVSARSWDASPGVGNAQAAALGANVVVRSVAVALFAISPTFHNLAWIHFTWAAVAAMAAAELVFAVVARYAERPVPLYRRVAALALVVSFVPNVGLFRADVPGGRSAVIATLMVMHVVDAALRVWLLPSLTRAREPDSDRVHDPRETTPSRR